MPYYKFMEEGSDQSGSFEVFWYDEGPDERGPGWYWWACWLECPQTNDPIGPFLSEEIAISNARGEL